MRSSTSNDLQIIKLIQNTKVYALFLSSRTLHSDTCTHAKTSVHRIPHRKTTIIRKYNTRNEIKLKEQNTKEKKQIRRNGSLAHTNRKRKQFAISTLSHRVSWQTFLQFLFSLLFSLITFRCLFCLFSLYVLTSASAVSTLWVFVSWFGLFSDLHARRTKWCCVKCCILIRIHSHVKIGIRLSSFVKCLC